MPRGPGRRHAHEKRLWALRKNPGFDQDTWLRTAPSGSFAAEVSFRGLPDLVVAQLLFGLQHRCHKGARTEIGNFRALIDRTVRPSGARRLEDVPAPAANSEALTLLNRTRAYAIRACKTPEGEYAKDIWDLMAFGHRGTLDFTVIPQPWLRESAKRWARDYLSRVRSKSTSSHARQHVNGLAKLAETLRARPDSGLDLAVLSRADIENFLNRMSFLEANGRMTTNTRRSYVRMARNVLRQARALGLTRPGGTMAGLPDDFTITRHDVPKAPEPPEEGQDLPPDVTRQLCAHLDLFEDMTCRELRLSVELLMDTGRRPEEICRLELHCLTRDGQGKPVLAYDNWKEQRLRRQMPIHEPTAKLILAQQERVRARFPDEPPSKLVLLPTQSLNLHGDRAVDSNHLSGMHRDWVEALPEFRLDDGTVFDKEKIFPYAYRNSFAQRHADAGVPIEVLSPLMDHDSYESTRCYYRVKKYACAKPSTRSPPCSSTATDSASGERSPPCWTPNEPDWRSGRCRSPSAPAPSPPTSPPEAAPAPAVPLRGMRPLLHRHLLPPRALRLPRRPAAAARAAAVDDRGRRLGPRRGHPVR
ncbi:tyrosine-type recombinase/integrase [Streptomyces sp. Ac-502]|uniref:tyrosine-type recombinase/integrase n=1 Tax=Streptomyces sp. Ac-502 TaxID=3342801 RepID=UPI0038629C79